MAQAFRDPAFVPWMTRRGLAILHALIGTGLAFVAVWLDDRSGREAPFLWGAWGLMVACWLGALLPQRRSTANLLRNPGLPIPRTGRATFLGLILFEIASFFTLNIPQGGDFPIPIAILALNLGIAIWVALSGLCFLVIRIPFSWKLWLGVVIGMAGSLIALFFEVLCLLYSGG